MTESEIAVHAVRDDGEQRTAGAVRVTDLENTYLSSQGHPCRPSAG